MLPFEPIAFDFDELSVTGPLRIDDQVFDDVTGDGLGNACAVGTNSTGIVGIEGFTFSD